MWFFDDNNNLIAKDTVNRTEYTNFYEVVVKRGTTQYMVWSSGDKTIVDDKESIQSSLTKRADVTADSLFSYTTKIDTNREFAQDTVKLRAEFVPIKLTVINAKNQKDKLNVEVLGSNSGFYIDRMFISNDATIIPTTYISPNNDNIYSFNILRQEELQDLTLSLFIEREERAYILEKYHLGNLLQEKNYDMKAEVLPEVVIEFDIALNFITISTKDWIIQEGVDIEL